MISLIEQAASLFPLPDTVTEILELLNNPRSSIRQITQVISRDVALTARILRLANSAYYGAARQVDSVSTAITLLGFDILKGYVLASSASMMLSQSLPFYGMSRNALWQHCEDVAGAAMLVGQDIGVGSLGATYAAGLLHDIGKVVVNQAMAGQMQPATASGSRGPAKPVSTVATNAPSLPRIAIAKGVCMLDAERLTVSSDHTDIGYSMAERWKLPGALVDGIGFHHDPRRAQRDPAMAALIHVADYCVHQIPDQEKESAELLYPISGSALPILGILPERLPALCDLVRRALVSSSAKPGTASAS